MSFERDSLAIDCLPFKLLVFVDDVQTVAGERVAHLSGRGYAYPDGLTVVANLVETPIGADSRPHDLGIVAFTAPDGNVWTINADGSSPVQVTGGSDQSLGAYYSSLAWSPDGTKLLMRRDSDASHDVQIYEPGKGLHAAYPLPGIVAPVYPGVAAWSADSEHILVTDYDQPGNACERSANQYAVRRVSIQSGLVEELYRAEVKGYVAGLLAAPDSRNVALTIGTACDSVSFALCLLALTPDATYAVVTGQLRCPPAARGGQLAWSPDGRYIAFTSRLQGRGDESSLSTGQPMQLLDARAATYYPIAWPLSFDRNIYGVTWLPDNRTLRIIEEVPRGLTDTALPERTLRRITIDGSRVPTVEVGQDRLLDVRPTLAPASLRGDYVLASGSKGELWVVAVSDKDARWRLTDAAVTGAVWSR